MASVSVCKTFNFNNAQFIDHSGLVTDVTSSEDIYMGCTYYRLFINKILLRNFFGGTCDFSRARKVTIVRNPEQLEITEINHSGKIYRFYVNHKTPEQWPSGEKYYPEINGHDVEPSLIEKEEVMAGAKAREIVVSEVEAGAAAGARVVQGAGAGAGAIKEKTKAANESILSRATTLLNALAMKELAIQWTLHNDEAVIICITTISGADAFFWFHPSDAPNGKFIHNFIKLGSTGYMCKEPYLHINIVGSNSSTINGKSAKFTAKSKLWGG